MLQILRFNSPTYLAAVIAAVMTLAAVAVFPASRAAWLNAATGAQLEVVKEFGSLRLSKFSFSPRPLVGSSNPSSRRLLPFILQVGFAFVKPGHHDEQD